MRLLSRTRYILADPGTNPLEEPIQEHPKNPMRIWIILGVLWVMAMCIWGIWQAVRPKTAQAAAAPIQPSLTATLTRTPTANPTKSITETALATVTKEPSQPAPTQLVTVIVHDPPVEKIVPYVITQIVPVQMTVVVTATPGPSPTVTITPSPAPTQTARIITATPGPTQTPWIVPAEPGATQTPWIIVITQIVEVTPTFTPTPTNTPETPVDPPGEGG